MTDGHPDYEVPQGVGDAGDGGSTTNTTDAAAGATADAAATAAAGSAGVGDPNANAGGTTTDAGEVIPKHRLDEVIAQREQDRARTIALEAELVKLRRAAAAAFGVETPGETAAPVDPKKQALRERMLDIMPELKDLLDLAAKKDDLLGVAGQLPHLQSSTKNYWDRVAAVTVEKARDAVAVALLGEGKTGKDLSEPQRQKVFKDFVGWIEQDATGERERRYEALDPALVNEFRDYVDGVYLAPLRRTSNAAALDKATRTAALPMGGSSSAAVGSVTNNKKPANEDEAAEAAWLDHTRQLSAQ